MGPLLAVVSTIFVWRYRRQAADPVIRWATLVIYVVAAFFFGLMIGPANPFVTAPGVTQGLGPNSLLQDNPLVAIHPPLLYLGFVGFTVPFAFAIGMLATGRVGERWQIETRRWTLVAWTFLSVGIVLGAWWSYQVLGWGGFWGWDPVENAALLPWLCGTAYLHSVLVQERRGLLRVWNLSLSIATFALTILGTFLTRSGVIQSVHAFSESVHRPAAHRLLLRRGHRRLRADRLAGRPPALARRASTRRSAARVRSWSTTCSSWASPSSSCSGPLFPLLYEALTQQQVTVGAPYFNTVAVPVGLALLFLMAVAPALSWRKIDGDGAVAAPGDPGLDRRGHGRALRRLRAAGRRAAARLRPGRLRRRLGGPGAGALGAGRPHAPRRAGGAAWSAGPTAAWSCTSGVVLLAVGDHRRHLVPPPGASWRCTAARWSPTTATASSSRDCAP